MQLSRRPVRQGLYDPWFEHDSCGVGFVAHMKGRNHHDLIPMAREILVNMTHRGAVGAEKNTGDGAGILTALPHALLEHIAATELGTSLPARGSFTAGLVFLPQDAGERKTCEEALERITGEEGQRLIGWRDVPRDNSTLGAGALAAEPVIRLVFIAAGEKVPQDAFERKLYVIRKRATSSLRGTPADTGHFFYISSLSTRNIVYKGMLTPEQLFDYYLDLADPLFETHLAMVHSRFSTNTFPSWDRAQPLRFMSHNGEINTLRGNINKMRAREGTLRSDLFGDDIRKTFPVVEPNLSDSGNFDNVLEMLLMAGRELPEAVMMMVPEAWHHHTHMPDHGRAMYEFMSAQIEPWDGPASIAFTDGRVIGAVLDRNGLRPSRYYVTDDDLVIMASEVGAAPIEPERVLRKGRLQPGRMFLVDFDKGRIVGDEELKDRIALRRPYRAWLEEHRLTLEQLPPPEQVPLLESSTILQRLRGFGYTLEHLQMILKPMAEDAMEPLGSMGNDTPLAVLSDRPRLLFDYFKQLFAQVTNPPIDSIREELIMSLASYIGPEGNLLMDSPEDAKRLWLDHPILSNGDLAKLKVLDFRNWRSMVVDCTFPATAGEGGLEPALDRIAGEVEDAIAQGYSLVILSDRAMCRERVAIPALLTTGAVHHRLVRTHKRTQIGIVLESGEPREVHHFCTLLGYGADAINPYLAYEAMWRLKQDDQIRQDLPDEDIVQAYQYAIQKGMRKVFGKMGISTLESYKGAQIFEILGLSDEVVDRCFAGTASRIQGAGFAQIARETLRRHALAFPAGNEQIGSDYLNPGDYQWRFGGEKHMWDPESITDLQIAVRTGDRSAFTRFSERQNERSTSQATLRGLLKFRKDTSSVPLEEVEPAEAIMRRFATGAMSYGSISIEAHETMAIAMNRIGGKSNTGEGGEERERYEPLPNGDSRRSAIKQVASGRFGVTIEYLTNADELQIKMAQGAKPGEGGELPGHKVFDRIARVRFSTPGVGLISPPPHHDIYSIEDLAQLIFDLKNANEHARISVKLVSEVGVGTVAAGVAKAHADHILVSGHDGGTGASALTGIKNAGLPWELGLAEAHQTLVLNDLRSRVVLQTDGQIKTGRDVVIAALLGAEEVGFATSALISMGCIMMRKCEKNTCPVGIATQDEVLRKKFTGKPEDVVNLVRFVAEETREIMAELGFRSFEEMVGRVDLLEMDEAVRNWKSEGVDLSGILTPITVTPGHSGVVCCVPQDHGLENVLDRKLVVAAEPLFRNGTPVQVEMRIGNTDRTTGGMLSHQIVRRIGAYELPPDSYRARFRGSAGQSFGAWLAQGVTLELEGDANDYVGKGLSGGRIIVYPPRSSRFAAEENVIIGNVAFYGATSGDAYIRGMAAERFCVRNSGARLVVEGVGDHGLEYMTGGRAVILGAVGRNFAAGMSGGIAWVLDPEERLSEYTNMGMVELLPLDEAEDEELLTLIRTHRELTGSTVADGVLADWPGARNRFVRVVSPVYRRILELQRLRRGDATEKADLLGAARSLEATPEPTGDARLSEEVLHG
ncbi:MAG: glutamate synthase large subunit [Spirochaetaceae bacterium]|nr:MAG: glutamate synthase large subunit [Spirochaetaceae bacterium]